MLGCNGVAGVFIANPPKSTVDATAAFPIFIKGSVDQLSAMAYWAAYNCPMIRELNAIVGRLDEYCVAVGGFYSEVDTVEFPAYAPQSLNPESTVHMLRQ